MRLIDADKLSNKTCAFGIRKCCSNCGEKRTIKNPYTNQSISCDDIRFDFLRMIDREKTVRAIPIEWIKKQIEEWKNWGPEGLSDDEWEYGNCLETLLENWEKENEVVK